MAVKGNPKISPDLGALNAEYGKIPPQAVELEEAVLGAVMLEKDAVLSVIDILIPGSFYKDAHQKIYRAIIDLSTQEKAIDILTVTEELRRSKTLEEVGDELQQMWIRVSKRSI